jgi:hypothetical protein
MTLTPRKTLNERRAEFVYDAARMHAVFLSLCEIAEKWILR